MIDFSSLFQAIAIEARCRLRWDGVNDETRRIKSRNVYIVQIPYIEDAFPARWFAETGIIPDPVGPRYKAETIELITLWVGMHRYMRIGYGPHVNVLAIAGGWGLTS